MTELKKISALSWVDHVPGNRLKGRHILITGAASGIGRSTAEVFAAEGAKLALLDSDGDGLAQISHMTGGIAILSDVTDATSLEQSIAKAAETLGSLDGVVNAAGISIRGSIESIDVESWKRVLDVNLAGPFLVVRGCLPWLRKAKFSTIVNIASGQGLLPAGPNISAYAASKGGLINLTRAMAIEFSPAIRVNSVCPGMVDTPMTAGRTGDGSQFALNRIATPLEVAQATLFLTSNESAFITGIALAVDGGRTFH